MTVKHEALRLVPLCRTHANSEGGGGDLAPRYLLLDATVSLFEVTGTQQRHAGYIDGKLERVLPDVP